MLTFIKLLTSVFAYDQGTDHGHSLVGGTAGPVLSWASGSCNVGSSVALQVLELETGKTCSESSGPCPGGGEWDLQLLSAFSLHRAQPERREGIIQESLLIMFLVSWV